MSARPFQDVRKQLPMPPPPNLRAHVPRRLMRNTLPETTGVAQVLRGYMFTKMELPEHEARNHGVPQYTSAEHVKLRYKFTNADLWDTLTGDVVDMMLNPREEYDPDYQQQVNIALLTCIKTLENKINKSNPPDWAGF